MNQRLNPEKLVDQLKESGFSEDYSQKITLLICKLLLTQICDTIEGIMEAIEEYCGVTVENSDQYLSEKGNRPITESCERIKKVVQEFLEK